MDELSSSLKQYNDQLQIVNEALVATNDEKERESLLSLHSDLNQLVKLTQESLDALTQVEAPKTTRATSSLNNDESKVIDEEYALFMEEMAKSGAYESESQPSNSTKPEHVEGNEGSDIEDELATLLGMKCAVYHTHKWGGQPTLHNAMVSAVVPRQDEDQFQDLQVRVFYTHPTHAEMLPCPFYLEGDCRFDDEKCRYSHGAVKHLSELKEAIEPNFDAVKVGSRILLKLKPPDDEDITLTKKTTEKYHLWHRGIVLSVDLEKRFCIVKLEHGVKTGEKRKSIPEEFHVRFEDIFPLNTEGDDNSSSDDSISDTEYPENKLPRAEEVIENTALIVEKSLLNNAPTIGEWERHTRGIGSKLMLAMGYVPGAGLGVRGAGRVSPVRARQVPAGRSLDHCMELSEKAAAQDPLKVRQRLKRLQKKEEDRNKRAYERAKERENRNVFNFLNRTIGNEAEKLEASGSSVNIKQSTSKDLNIEQFKITEDTKRLEREIIKLNTSLARYTSGTEGHKNINVQLVQKSRELNMLKNKEQQIVKEQKHRKDKQKNDCVLAIMLYMKYILI